MDVPLPVITLTTAKPAELAQNWNYIIDQIEGALATIPALVELERALKVTKLQFVLIVGLIVTWGILVMKNWHGDALSDLVGYFYPAYASLRAVESGDSAKYAQWLTYWQVVLFGGAKVAENFSQELLSILPFYFIFKIMFLCWAMSRYTQHKWVGRGGHHLAFY
eukprot:jgi/Hompol1/3228/HPOL_003170-RA